jgi:hypothetical protein
VSQGAFYKWSTESTVEQLFAIGGTIPVKRFGARDPQRSLDLSHCCSELIEVSPIFVE